MIKKPLLSLIIIMVIGCSPTKKTSTEASELVDDTVSLKGTTNGVLDATQLQFFKQNYNWKDQKNLIINFKESESDCRLAGYKWGTEPKQFKKNKQDWDDMYSRINLEHVLNIFVYSETEKIKKYIDNETYYKDINEELLNNVIYNERGCYGIIVINENGKFISYNSHYDDRHVRTYISFVNE